MGAAILFGLAVLLTSAAAQAGPARERRLHVASAEASSYLVNDWNNFQENYLPLYVGDDDPRTAWSLKTEGIGEWLRVHVTPMEGATQVRMKIRNGYQKSPRLFEANSRAQELTVVLLPSKKTVDVTLTDTFGLAGDRGRAAGRRVRGRRAAGEVGLPGQEVRRPLHLRRAALRHRHVVGQPGVREAAPREDRDVEEGTRRRRQDVQDQLGQSCRSRRSTVSVAPDATKMDPTGGQACDRKVGCWMETSLIRAAATVGSGPQASELRTATALAHNEFAAMTAVRISVQRQTPHPHASTGLPPSLAVCEEDPCEQTRCRFR